MIELNLILLLQLIHAKGDVNELLRRGFTFAQISDLIDQAAEEGLVVEETEGLKLTEDGIEEVNRLRQDGRWIQPRDDLRIAKLSPNEIYLPSEKDSFF